jgi:hypothetical protein
MKALNDKTNVIPPILREYILAMFDEKANSVNVRKNYRDNIDTIRAVCDEAVKKFDRDQLKYVNSGKQRRSVIRAAHAE